MGGRLLLQVAPDTWGAFPLDMDKCSAFAQKSCEGDGIFLVQAQRPDAVWLMMAPPGSGAKVNGEALFLGIHALRDKDEIRLPDGQRVFFSTQDPAHVQPFPGIGHAAFCPRCKQEITDGTPSVRCPNPKCGIWHHEEGDMNCWTYGAHCALCEHPSDLDTEVLWTPEMC